MSPKYMLQVLLATCILMFVNGKRSTREPIRARKGQISNGFIGQTNGALRLRTQSGTTLTNNFGTGAVELYYNGEWGTICSTSSFGRTEASVICNDVSNSSTFVATYTTTSFSYGSANLSQPIVTDVNCSSNTSTILQCSLNFTANDCDELTDAVVVSCDGKFNHYDLGGIFYVVTIFFGIFIGLVVCGAVLPTIILLLFTIIAIIIVCAGTIDARRTGTTKGPA